MVPLLLVMCCVGSFVGIIAAEDWQRTFQKSTWEISLTRRTVDTQITMETLEAKTVTECGFVCSDGLGVQALSFYFIQETHTCHCNTALDTNLEDNTVAQIYYGTLQTLYKKDEFEERFNRHTVWPFLPNCLSLLEENYKQNAVYTIHPIGGTATDTWCDMNNGGWTLIQRRKDGSEDFYRGWTDYVNGFGNRTGEFWLGLENIHHLTKAGSQLLIYLAPFPGVAPPSMVAYYTSFVILDASYEYRLHVSGFTGITGDCGDSLKFHNGRRFSTFDNDNDLTADSNCAEWFPGAWWYRNCHFSNLNGHYYTPDEFSNSNAFLDGIHWRDCWGDDISLKFSTMKIRKP